VAAVERFYRKRRLAAIGIGQTQFVKGASQQRTEAAATGKAAPDSADGGPACGIRRRPRATRARRFHRRKTRGLYSASPISWGGNLLH
jgi:hypothetical protein